MTKNVRIAVRKMAREITHDEATEVAGGLPPSFKNQCDKDQSQCWINVEQNGRIISTTVVDDE